MKHQMIFSGLVVSFVLVVLISLTLGRYPVSVSDIFGFVGGIFSDKPAPDGRQYLILKNVLVDIRLPRIIAAVLIGAGLSVSGTVFQSMFVNPLVSPGLLGVLAGASFGAAFGMIWAKTWWMVQILAFSFGMVAVFASLMISSVHQGDRLLMLILGGIISGALFTALLSIIKYLADPYEQLPAIIYWLMGGLSTVNGNTVLTAAVPMIAGMVMLFFLSGYLNVLSMGDEEARSLGINVPFLRMFFIFLATVISALTVVMGGMIGWVGLLIPHISRMIVGPDNRNLLPVSAVIGAIYLLIADDMARLVFSVEIPIGILTSLMGIPFFAFILRHTQKGWQ